MDIKFDPKCEHFDPYECWEAADCCYVEEATYGDPNDDDFEEVLYCNAPEDFVCPLIEKRVNKIQNF